MREGERRVSLNFDAFIQSMPPPNGRDEIDSRGFEQEEEVVVVVAVMVGGIQHNWKGTITDI